MEDGLVIVNFFEKESAGRRCWASLGTVPGQEEVGYLSGRAFALADFDQGAGKNADHLAEKTVAGHAQRPRVRAAQLGRATGCKQSADCAASVNDGPVAGADPLKAGEIVGSHKQLQAVAQPAEFKAAGDVGPVEPVAGQLHLTGKKIIAIGFAHGVVAAVKIGRGLFGCENADVPGQHRIDALEKSDCRDRGGGVEVGDHAEGVDSGIGATSPVENDRFAAQQGELLFQLALNGAFALDRKSVV